MSSFKNFNRTLASGSAKASFSFEYSFDAIEMVSKSTDMSFVENE